MGKIWTFDPLEQPFASRRMPVYAKNGMVCTSQPLAAQAGLAALQAGGNAVDAAIAASAALTVTEPTSSGLGGDLFAAVWHQGKLIGLNGSGALPEEADTGAWEGLSEIPEKSWLPVTVPGLPGAWAALQKRFGARSLRENLQAAEDYARDGFPVSPVVALMWERSARRMEPLAGRPEFEEWFRVFTKGGKAPGPGNLWKLPDHARTLRLMGESEGQAFYQGELAGQMDAFARRTGGALRRADLEAYEPEWVTPLSVRFRGYDVWELPPNGQGLVALLALQILEGFAPEPWGEQSSHRQIEAVKLAFAAAKGQIADPRFAPAPLEELLSPAFAASMRERMGGRAAGAGSPGSSGGTAYVCTGDREGNMVSLIQSSYDDFGAGIVVPGTGINLQNRGCSFSLERTSPNRPEPGKRPYHTIIPGFLTKDGAAVGAFGVIGAYMQPQGHVQVLANLLEAGMEPQQALDAPRWQWRQGACVEAEPQMGEAWFRALRDRGHQLTAVPDCYGMGRGQVLLREADGVYIGATEARADGCAAGF